MKTKLHIFCFAWMVVNYANAQTNTFPPTGNVGIGTLSPSTTLHVTGTGRFGGSANYMQTDASGNLSFVGTAGYRVSGNRYAFQYAGNPNFGLFFNSTSSQYEFRNGSAVPVFFVNANSGNGVFNGTLKIGTYTLPATDGTNGQVLATNGAGTVNWSTVSGSSGANTALSNLAATSINQNLVANADSAFDLGNKIKRWRNLFIAGKIGIGVSSPSAKLDIRTGTSDTSFALQITHPLPFGLISTIFSVKDNGNIGIGTSVPSAPLHVVGNAYFQGSVGIGTNSPNYPLDVCGIMRAKEILVQTGWCDYVFDKSYQLKPLDEVADFIAQYQHLPNIPPAAEVETNGLKVADMSAKMMEKIEELTLYMIDMNKRLKVLENENSILRNQLADQNK